MFQIWGQKKDIEEKGKARGFLVVLTYTEKDFLYSERHYKILAKNTSKDN